MLKRTSFLNLPQALILFGLLTAIFTRFVFLGQIPWGLYWDEVAMYVDLKSLLATGKDMHGLAWYQLIYPSYGDYKAPLYLWQAFLASKLFGLSEFSLRLPSAVVGSLTILLTALISLKLFASLTSKTKKTDQVLSRSMLFLSTALVVAFSPWAFGFSRSAFEAHLSQLLLAFSIYLVLLFDPWHRLKRFWLVGSVLFGALAIYGYYSSRYVWPGVFLAALVFKWQKEKKKRTVKTVTTYLGVGFLSLLSVFLLVLPLKHSSYYQASQALRFSTSSVVDAKHREAQVLQANQYRQLAGNRVWDRLFFHRDLFLLTDLAKNFASNLSLNNLFLTGDANLRHGVGLFGLFLVSFLPLFLVGLYKLGKDHQAALGLLLVWWFLALLPASVPAETPHALRSLNALVPLSIIIGFGLAYSLSYLQRLKSSYLGKLLSLGLVLVLVLNFGYFVNYYFKHYPLASTSAWQVGYRELAQAIYRTRQDLPVVILVPDDRFYLWLMAYGPYKGSEFLNWSEKDFRKLDFDQVYFTQPEVKFDQLIKTKKTFWVAGDLSKLSQFLKQKGVKLGLCFPVRPGDEGEFKPAVCLVRGKKS